MPFRLPEPLDTLDDYQLAILEPIAEQVTIPRDTCIFEIDSPGDSCYIIEEGRIRLEIPPEGSNPDDHENILKYLEPGEWLGEMALLDHFPRSATAFAHTEVKARRIDSKDLGQLAREHPKLVGIIYAALGRAASLKLRQMTDRLAGYIFNQQNPMVDDMVARAQTAQAEFAGWDEARVERLLKDLAEAVNDHAPELARLNVEETGIGKVSSKLEKIEVGSLGVYNTLAGQVAAGHFADEANGTVLDLAAALGVVFGLVPVTNPVSTFIFKVLICLKGRNALILSVSRRALQTATRTGEIIQDVLKAHDAPLDIAQWIQKNNSRKTTADFMAHPGVSFILATGGPSMVKAAYSSGTPSIGVGAGNAPALVCSDADVSAAAQRIMESKTFDNGVVCCSEHNIVVVEAVREEFLTALEDLGAAVLMPDEIPGFTAKTVEAVKNHFIPEIIGKSAAEIAKLAGIQRDRSIRLIIVPVDQVDSEDVYSQEKLAPVLSLFTASEEKEGIEICRRLLEIDGSGHTAIIHTRDNALAEQFGLAMPASRILVNAPGVQGGIGAVTGLMPSLTLGCGTFGGNSTTDNVTYKHLINVKRLAYYTPK
jgi:acetaldehyde dehydrogenase / alcohol dehydrogenase